MRHALILEYGGCGNVYAYNYSKDPVNWYEEDRGLNTTDWLMSDMSLHGGHPYMTRNNKGFTLTQTLVAMVMAGIVMAGVYSAYYSQQK